MVLSSYKKLYVLLLGSFSIVYSQAEPSFVFVDGHNREITVQLLTRQDIEQEATRKRMADLCLDCFGQEMANETQESLWYIGAIVHMGFVFYAQDIIEEWGSNEIIVFAAFHQGKMIGLATKKITEDDEVRLIIAPAYAISEIEDVLKKVVKAQQLQLKLMQ